MNTPNIATERDLSLDILRVTGLLCIMLAHTHPPVIVRQLRNFDVPLMVLVSASSFMLTSKKSNVSYWKYVCKRVVRLTVPSWCFLSIYFVALAVLFHLSQKEFPYSFNEVVGSYFFLQGIGYVWIIRIFVLVSITSPLMLELYEKYSAKIYVVILFLTYTFYELSYYMVSKVNHLYLFTAGALNYIIFPCLSYSCIFGFGLLLYHIENKKNYLKISCFFLFVYALFFQRYYAGMGIKASWTDFNVIFTAIGTQIAKYPPRIYYLSYALSVSIALFFLANKYTEKISCHTFIYHSIEIISKLSLWIYLWHILVKFLMVKVDRKISFISLNWFASFFFLVVFSIVLALLWDKAISIAIVKSENKYLKKILLAIAG